MPDQPRSFRADAIVLRHTDIGEADRLITFFTREHGKVRAVVKGARRIKSRKAGHLEPFTHVSLLLARGSGWPIITQVETIEAHFGLRESLEHTGSAAYVVELIDRFFYEENAENLPVFRLLAETLARLDSQQDPWVIIRYFEMRFLDFLGFRPQLFHCSNCEKEIKPENQYFSPSQGGVICPSCGQGLPGLWRISMETLKYLRHFQRSKFDVAARAQPSDVIRVEVEKLMQAHFTYLLERSLNTPAFIQRMKTDTSLN